MTDKLTPEQEDAFAEIFADVIVAGDKLIRTVFVPAIMMSGGKTDIVRNALVAGIMAEWALRPDRSQDDTKEELKSLVEALIDVLGETLNDPNAPRGISAALTLRESMTRQTTTQGETA